MAKSMEWEITAVYELSPRQRRMLRLDGVSTAGAIDGLMAVAKACSGSELPKMGDGWRGGFQRDNKGTKE